LKTHFRLITDVLSEIRSEVMGKVVETTDAADFADWEWNVEAAVSAALSWSRRHTTTTKLLQYDRLLRLFNEFFKTRIAAQWIPERMQTEFAIA
jgi:hypothetical protein